MKAVIIDKFGGPEELKYVDVEKPAPAPDEVLVKNEYIGVGKPDFVTRSGICPFMEKTPPGLIVGNECCGIIEAVGSDVTDFKPGMKVGVTSGLGYGSHAEYIAVPAKFVTEFPKDFPSKYIIGFLNYMVAYALVNEIGTGTNGKSIYIEGAAGGLGTAVIQTALLEGKQVIASAGTDEKCKYIKSLGAHCVFNHKTESAKDVILKFTEGKGVDVIYDQLAGEKLKGRFEYLADFGMIVLYNWLEEDPKFNQLETIIDCSKHAWALRSFSFKVYDANPDRLANVRKICMERIIKGELVPRYYMDLPLSEAGQAHRLMDDLKLMGKMILHV